MHLNSDKPQIPLIAYNVLLYTIYIVINFYQYRESFLKFILLKYSEFTTLC